MECDDIRIVIVSNGIACGDVVFGGEVDCCERDNSSKYIELKTSRKIESWKQESNFKR